MLSVAALSFQPSAFARQNTDEQPSANADPVQAFNVCKQSLQQSAVEAGITPATAERVFANINYQPRVIELDRSQPEFVQTFPGYFSKRVNDWRINKGRQLAGEHKALLQELVKQYGIPAQYLLAFWGLETNFGGYKGKMPVLDSLATLACDPRRSAFFTRELLTAVKLLEEQSLEQEKMVGSWAGAMGHTQFMPSAYANYAVDGDGDGQINLWESEADALTSAANFLSQLGWQPGFRWGREVTLPDGFDYSLLGYSKRRTVSEWNKLGITRANGDALGSSDMNAYLVMPAGHEGPTFLAYPNFRVIMRWNNSEFYAIAVGRLADRIAGDGELVASLPPLPNYRRDDIKAMQEQLNQKGIDVGGADGILGPATREGIREFQRRSDMIADGFPSLAVMQALGIEVTPTS
ncbi:MAG: lytic murein transglycosylase [Alteromonadaceae bacterium TMED7]|jgi:membrane-bound lytic murein transglycosylase B|nr:lytic transglycosylase [Alteromonadaceae bacterium]MCP4862779.1 lytic murein transglycosylase [Alteromonas sp.]RPH14832.1 MAG: lytic murein transglycosylase [Alteromonadaceae bacterium TMED7]